MFRIISVAIALFFQTQAAISAESVTAADSPIVVYESTESYGDVKSNIEFAITGRGMLVTNTLHISDMLNRTAADTGLEDKLYEIAESLEFCSITMSYRMSQAHPANMATCPLTLSVYQIAGDTDHTYIAYRRPEMLGEAGAVEEDLTKLMEGIIQEALE